MLVSKLAPLDDIDTAAAESCDEEKLRVRGVGRDVRVRVEVRRNGGFFFRPRRPSLPPPVSQ